MCKSFDKGVPVRVAAGAVEELMSHEDIEVIVDLRDGETSSGEVEFWTSDLTHDFVTINSGVGN